MKYRSGLPYPEIKVERKNLDYAQILLNDYAGMVSELTAILLYSYQHFNYTNELSEVIGKISIVEMKHLEMLGETIKLLGIDPIYKTVTTDNQLLPWNSDWVNYETDIISALKIDIKSEQQAILNYQEHIRVIEDIHIKALLKRIILDEEQHIICFENLLSQYQK